MYIDAQLLVAFGIHLPNTEGFANSCRSAGISYTRQIASRLLPCVETLESSGVFPLRKRLRTGIQNVVSLLN